MYDKRWQLTEEVKNKYIPIIKSFFKAINNLSTAEIEQFDKESSCMNFSDTELNPYTLWKLLEEEFGYEEIDIDRNGWEMDFWIELEHPIATSNCKRVQVKGCGITFELKLCVKIFD